RAGEHQGRSQAEQGPVLGAERLGLCGIDDERRGALVALREGPQLAADREAGTAPAEETARLDHGDEIAGCRRAGRGTPEPGEVILETFRTRRRRRPGEDTQLAHRFVQAGSTATGSAVPFVTAARRLRL